MRHGASTSYAAVRQRCESCPTLLKRGEDYILYSILDFIVDNYLPVVESIHEEVDAIEERLLRKALHESRGRAALHAAARSAAPAQGGGAAGRGLPAPASMPRTLLIEPQMQPLFRDITDHVQRVQEEIDSLREVLAFAFEASLMAGQAQQNAITRKLAAWAAILAVPTAVAGIYGMNFEHMPELKWAYGYYVVLGGIVDAVRPALYPLPTGRLA